jgi:hypothetical protein
VVVDQKIKNFLDIMNVPYKVVTGDVCTRVEKVKRIVGFEPKKGRVLCSVRKEDDALKLPKEVSDIAESKNQ